MDLDISTVLTDFKGRIIRRPGDDGAEPVPATLGWAMQEALVAVEHDNDKEGEKYSRGKIAKKIADAEATGVVSLTNEEVAKAMLLVEKAPFFNPIVVSTIWDLVAAQGK